MGSELIAASQIVASQAAVTARFERRVTEGRAPASVVAVFDSAGLIYSAGCGDRGDGQPPSVDTAFRIASVTKSFTAAALLVHLDRGVVQLDQPVTDLLTLPRLTGPDGSPVRSPTLAELLSMSGGLPNDDPWADRQESMSSSEFEALLSAGIRFSSPPGSRYEYSNLGYAMVGAVLERLTGSTLVEVITDELITPLGLRGIGFDAHLQGVDAVAAGYVRRADAWQLEPFTAPGAFSAIGGIVATPSGLSTWLRWLNSATDDRVLSRSSRELMRTARTPIEVRSADPTHYGLGLVLQEHHRHGLIAAHSGGYPGFGAHVRWHVDSGMGVLAMENARYSAPVEPVTDALLMILDECLPQPLPELWPQTLAARDAVEGLLRHWDDEVASRLFADNVAMDEPISTRRATIEALIAEVGPLADPLALEVAAVEAPSPARMAWIVQGARGQLRCQIALTPTEPPLVQTLQISRR